MNVILSMEGAVKVALMSLALIHVPANQDLFLTVIITTAQVY